MRTAAILLLDVFPLGEWNLQPMRNTTSKIQVLNTMHNTIHAVKCEGGLCGWGRGVMVVICAQVWSVSATL